MDRFNSKEEPEDLYNHPIFLEGVTARIEGKSTFDNPYSHNMGTSIIDLRKRNIWAMGWCDQDMIILSEMTKMYEEGQHYFVGGSTDAHPELCDNCGKIYSDNCHIPHQQQSKEQPEMVICPKAKECGKDCLAPNHAIEHKNNWACGDEGDCPACIPVSQPLEGGLLLTDEELEKVIRHSWGIGSQDIDHIMQFKLVAIDAIKAQLLKVQPEIAKLQAKLNQILLDNEALEQIRQLYFKKIQEQGSRIKELETQLKVHEQRVTEIQSAYLKWNDKTVKQRDKLQAEAKSEASGACDIEN
jgi:hypothetical protein